VRVLIACLDYPEWKSLLRGVLVRWTIYGLSCSAVRLEIIQYEARFLERGLGHELSFDFLYIIYPKLLSTQEKFSQVSQDYIGLHAKRQ
jgi:hypothetical protein